jgi:hypothetical protein
MEDWMGSEDIVVVLLLYKTKIINEISHLCSSVSSSLIILGCILVRARGCTTNHLIRPLISHKTNTHDKLRLVRWRRHPRQILGLARGTHGNSLPSGRWQWHLLSAHTLASNVVTHQGTTLDTCYINSLESIDAIDDVKLDILALAKGLVVAIQRFHSGMVNKDVLSLLLAIANGDESIS